MLGFNLALNFRRRYSGTLVEQAAAEEGLISLLHLVVLRENVT